METASVKPFIVRIPDTTKVSVEGGALRVTGPKGELVQPIVREIAVNIENGQAVITRQGNSKRLKALHGLIRALLQNAVRGVNEGYTKTLELSGVGYRAQASGDELTLSVGFSHQVKMKAPKGITFAVVENKIKVSGNDKHMVGQIAHSIRAVRPPEPYKGKGIKYEGERIRRKAGKAAAKAAGAK